MVAITISSSIHAQNTTTKSNAQIEAEKKFEINLREKLNNAEKPNLNGKYTCVVTATFKPDPAGGIDILYVPAPSDSLVHYPTHQTVKKQN